MSLVTAGCPRKKSSLNNFKNYPKIRNFNVFLNVNLKRYSFLEMDTTLYREQINNTIVGLKAPPIRKAFKLNNNFILIPTISKSTPSFTLDQSINQ